MLDRFLKPQFIGTEESKGNLGLSYKSMYAKINALMKSSNLVRINHVKAAKLLYLAKGIEVTNNSFGLLTMGNLDILVIYDDYGTVGYNRLYDLTYLENKPILFIYYNAMFNSSLPFSERFSNLYMLYLELVTLSLLPGMTIMPCTIYSAIAKYAPMVLAVKTLINNNETFTVHDVDLDYIPQEDWGLFTEEIFNTIVSIKDMDDMLVYGALCDYVIIEK